MPLTDQLRSEIREHMNELPHGWCRVEKAEKLAALILEQKLERIIEIGIFGGRSIVPMALACRHQKRGCVHGLDPWDKEHALEGEMDQAQIDWWQKLDLEAIREGFEQHVIKHRLFEWLHWSRFGSVEMAPWFPNGWADLIHLDADHSELASCRDVHLWMPKLRNNGWFIFDDSNWPTQQKAKVILDRTFIHAETLAYPDGQAFSIYRKSECWVAGEQAA